MKTVNRFVGLRFAAPGLVRIEWSVIRWLCQVVGFPRESGGILTSGVPSPVLSPSILPGVTACRPIS